MCISSVNLGQITKSYLSTHDVYKLNEYRNSILISVNTSKGSTFFSILDDIYEKEEDPAARKDVLKLLYEVLSRTENVFEASEVIGFLSKCIKLTICVQLCVNATKALLERHFDSENINYQDLEIFYKKLCEKKISQYPQQCRMDFLSVSQRMVDLVIEGKIDGLDIELLCDSISEEKDPRNLLTMFDLLSKLASSVARRDNEFESIAKTYLVYYPIQFVPPKKDKICITPLQLKKALLTCFKSSEKLAQYSMELLLDSLYSEFNVDDGLSILRDTLYFLKNCKPVYGSSFKRFCNKFVQVLKMELMAPSVTDSMFDRLKISEDELKSVQDEAKKTFNELYNVEEANDSLFADGDEKRLNNIRQEEHSTEHREMDVIDNQMEEEIESNTHEDLGELDIENINKIGKSYYRDPGNYDEKVRLYAEILRLFMESFDELEEDKLIEMLDGIRISINSNYSLAYIVEVLSENSKLHNKIVDWIIIPQLMDIYSVNNEASDEDSVSSNASKRNEKLDMHNIINKCILPKILINFKDDQISETLLEFLLKIDRKSNEFFKDESEAVKKHLKLLMLASCIVRGKVIYELIERVARDLFLNDSIEGSASVNNDNTTSVINGFEASDNCCDNYTSSGHDYDDNNESNSNSDFDDEIYYSDSVTYGDGRSSNSGDENDTLRGQMGSRAVTEKNVKNVSKSAKNNRFIDKIIRFINSGDNEDETSYLLEVILNLKILTAIYRTHTGMCYPIVKALNSMMPVSVRVTGDNFMLVRMKQMSRKNNLIISSQMSELLGMALSKWSRSKVDYDMDRLVRNIIQVVFTNLELKINSLNIKYIKTQSSIEYQKSNSINATHSDSSNSTSNYTSNGSRIRSDTSGISSRTRSSSSSSSGSDSSSIMSSRSIDYKMLDSNTTAKAHVRLTSCSNSEQTNVSASTTSRRIRGGRLANRQIGLIGSATNAQNRSDSTAENKQIRDNGMANGILSNIFSIINMAGQKSHGFPGVCRDASSGERSVNRISMDGCGSEGKNDVTSSIIAADENGCNEESDFGDALSIVYSNLFIEVLESKCKVMFFEMYERRRILEFFTKTFNYYKHTLDLAEESSYIEVFKAKKLPVILSNLSSGLEIKMRKYMDHRTLFLNIYLKRPELSENTLKCTQSYLENVYYNYGSLGLSLVNLESLFVYNEYFKNVDRIFECTYSNGSVLVKTVQNVYSYDFKEITEQIIALNNYKICNKEYDELFFLFLPLSLNYNNGAHRLQLMDMRERYKRTNYVLKSGPSDNGESDGKDENKNFDEKTERLLNIVFEKLINENHELLPNYTHRLAENYFSKLELDISLLLILLNGEVRKIKKEYLNQVVETMSEVVKSIFKRQDGLELSDESEGVGEYVNWCCNKYVLYVQSLLFRVMTEINNSSKEENQVESMKEVLSGKMELLIEDLLNIYKLSKVPFCRILSILTIHLMIKSKRVTVDKETKKKVIKCSINFLGDSNKKVRSIAVLCRREWLSKQDEW